MGQPAAKQGDQVTATDNHGATATDTVTVTITGTNDAPTVSTTPNHADFTEAADASAQDLSASGTVNFDDIDTNDTVAISSAYNSDISWSGGTLSNALKTQLTSGTFAASAAAGAAPGSTGWSYTASGIDLDFLAKEVGVEVGCISTGPERNETIILKGSRFEKLVG